ncbi:MAG: dienelactone hydrolase family protein [Polyangiales bacterium]
MSQTLPASAPNGDLSTFEREVFESDGFSHAVFRKGNGPAVLVITEMPGISPQVLGFADRVVALGCTAVLPDLFGDAGRDPLAHGKLRAVPYMLRSVAQACISREFTTFALGKSSPVVGFLRSLAAREHKRCGGPGVGVVGMCFTGGFALAMATEPTVVAPVLSQPSLPLTLSERHKAAIDCSDADLQRVAARCSNEGLRVLGLRFKEDPAVPGARFRFLKERLGDGFIAVELSPSARHPSGPLPKAHSVLTGDLIDEPGQPTRAALDQVLAFFRDKLIGDTQSVHA